MKSNGTKKRGVKSLLRLKGDPDYVAKGFALGSFIGVMPIPGLQMIVSRGIATVVKVHKTAAMIGVFNTNLFTGAFIYAFNYWLGKTVLRLSPTFEFPDKINLQFLSTLLSAGSDVFVSLLLGGFISGIVSCIISYYLIIYLLTRKRLKKESIKNSELYTVITGASKGLGKCLAVECAKRGRNLILISLPGELVLNTAEDISRKYKVKAIGYETDLTRKKNIYGLVKWIASNYQVDMLINNAGIGGTNQFSSVKINYIETIIHLNMKALVLLTHMLLPLLQSQAKSYILNIASMAAFGPMPYKTIYPASKAFVSSFSKGLNSELSKTSVTISVAYPSGIATNPEIAERMEKHGRLIRATFLSPERIAEICIKRTLACKAIIIPGLFTKISRILIKFIPEEIRLNIFSKNLKKELLING